MSVEKLCSVNRGSIAISRASVQASDGSNSTPYEIGYDTAGQATSFTDQLGRNTQVAYDGVGNQTEVVWPAGTSGTGSYSVIYKYDAMNQMQTVNEGGTNKLLAQYSWDALSRAHSISYGDGTSDSYSQYDAGDNLQPLPQTYNGSNNSATFNYTWLMNHQRNSAGVNNPLFQYVPQAGTVSYGTANADNGLTTVGGTTMTYDGNYNLTYDGTNTLSYDVENRLIQAVNPVSETSGYLYDPLGHRKQKVVGVNTVMPVAPDFVLAGGEEIADYYETSATWRLTVRGVGGLPLVTVVPGGAGSEEIVYVHHDLKGSTVALTEAGSNGPAEIYTYSDYGAPQSGSWLAYQYAGYRYDSETGLYYMPARNYSPALGRFLQTDPSGFGGGFNLYAYAGNAPVNLTDSTGLCPDGGKLTITLSASIANPFMAVLGVPSLTVSAQSNVCSEDGPHIVRDAAVKALSSLNPGQDETNNVTPRDGNFAQVADPSKIDTKTWTGAATVHGTSKESPTIPGQSTFVVKLYNDPQRGNIVAVVYPNGTWQHLAGVWPFLKGSTSVNVPAARAYMGCP